jgi:hypothetical protein
MSWPYPAEDQDPWFDTFESMVQGMDSSGYASREDRELIMGGGGAVSFVASTGTLSWTEDLEIYSTIRGNKLILSAGSVVLQDGNLFYVDLVRSPTDNIIVTPTVAIQTPGSDTAYVIGVRVGASVYFRFGSVINDGETIDIFGAGGGAAFTDTYERHATFTIPDGSSTTQEATVGRVIYPGSIIGLAAEITEAVTAGTITVNVKVGGVTTLSVELNSGSYPEAREITAAAGTYPVVQNDELTVEVVPAGYTNASGLDGGLTVDFALITGIASAPGDIPDASNTQKGITKLSVAPAVPNDPIAVGDNDSRLGTSYISQNRRIIYTATGSEGTDFTVTISPVMPSTNYAVFATLATIAGAHVTINIPTADRATNQFRVLTSGTLTASDTIFFHVVAF